VLCYSVNLGVSDSENLLGVEFLALQGISEVSSKNLQEFMPALEADELRFVIVESRLLLAN